MRRKTLKTLFFIIGILAIAAAVLIPCLGLGIGRSASFYSYGGDAYTGIQNTAARATNNILYIGELLQIVSTGLFAIVGLVLISLAICIKPNNPPVYTVIQQTCTVENEQSNNTL